VAEASSLVPPLEELEPPEDPPLEAEPLEEPELLEEDEPLEEPEPLEELEPPEEATAPGPPPSTRVTPGASTPEHAAAEASKARPVSVPSRKLSLAIRLNCQRDGSSTS
jgi:hypothetical protein